MPVKSFRPRLQGQAYFHAFKKNIIKEDQGISLQKSSMN